MVEEIPNRIDDIMNSNGRPKSKTLQNEALRPVQQSKLITIKQDEGEDEVNLGFSRKVTTIRGDDDAKV